MAGRDLESILRLIVQEVLMRTRMAANVGFGIWDLEFGTKLYPKPC